MRELLYMLAFSLAANASQPFYDRVHDSKVFGEQRKYRIFLPAGYESQSKQYPVIYYFHGHSDRYTLEKYDNGRDTVPKIAAFVANHEVIVVAADGYVARDYTGFYGGTPYDVRREGGDFDYGKYFLELTRHIDANYRTLSSRRYRATSGLSMGGFMSLYLSARYPDRIGSASSFNPGPEFYVGEKDARSLWRPKDHVLNQEHSMIRLIRASGDYISQYHEETRIAYAITPAVDFEYRQDEYHRHWATSIAETFEFHMRAFANPALDTAPLEWNYTTPHRESEVWNYRVKANSAGPSLLSLHHVSQGGLGIYTRRWAPDGPADGRTLTGFDAGGRFLDLRDGLAPDKFTAEVRSVVPWPAKNAPEPESSISWALRPEGPYRVLWTYDPKLTWRDGQTIRRTLRWPEVDRSVRDLPAGTHRIYVRYRIRGLAIDDFRLASISSANPASSTLQITHLWRENGQARKHIQSIGETRAPQIYSVQTSDTGIITNEAVIMECLEKK